MITHIPGLHYNITPNIKAFYFRNVTGFKLKFTFTESARYDLQSDDQFDWNKLTGVYVDDEYEPKTALMIGWRYNLKTDKVEVCFYTHLEGQRVWTSVIKELSIGEEGEVTFDFRKAYIVAKMFGKSHFLYTTRNPSRYVQGFFGGNRTPNRAIFIKTTLTLKS